MLVGYLYPKTVSASSFTTGCLNRLFKCFSRRSDFIQSAQLGGLPVSANSNIQGVNSNSANNNVPPVREFEGRGVSIGGGSSKQNNQ